jgi:hypothetical protein
MRTNKPNQSSQSKVPIITYIFIEVVLCHWVHLHRYNMSLSLSIYLTHTHKLQSDNQSRKKTQNHRMIFFGWKLNNPPPRLTLYIRPSISGSVPSSRGPCVVARKQQKAQKYKTNTTGIAIAKGQSWLNYQRRGFATGRSSRSREWRGGGQTPWVFPVPFLMVPDPGHSGRRGITACSWLGFRFAYSFLFFFLYFLGDLSKM